MTKKPTAVQLRRARKIPLEATMTEKLEMLPLAEALWRADGYVPGANNARSEMSLGYQSVATQNYWIEKAKRTIEALGQGANRPELAPAPRPSPKTSMLGIVPFCDVCLNQDPNRMEMIVARAANGANYRAGTKCSSCGHE